MNTPPQRHFEDDATQTCRDVHTQTALSSSLKAWGGEGVRMWRRDTTLVCLEANTVYLTSEITKYHAFVMYLFYVFKSMFRHIKKIFSGAYYF